MSRYDDKYSRSSHRDGRGDGERRERFSRDDSSSSRSKRRRSCSQERYDKRSQRDSDDRRKSRRRSSSEEKATGQIAPITFSFLNFKSAFHRILTGYNVSEKLVDDVSDFWQFVRKYESALLSRGQNVLDTNAEASLDEAVIPREFNKILLINFKMKPSKHQTCSFSNPQNPDQTIDEKRIRVFLSIVQLYVDLQQKQRFQKLKKLRKFQASLPIAAYEKEIVEAVKKESILILAGDTGCGKSTQVPQYLYNAGFDKIACTQPRRIACIGLSKR